MVNILSNNTVQMSTALVDKPDKPEYYFFITASRQKGAKWKRVDWRAQSVLIS